MDLSQNGGKKGKVKKIQSRDDDDDFGRETTLDVSNYNGSGDVLGIRRRKERRDYMAKRCEGK